MSATRRPGMQSGTVVLKNGAEEAEVFVRAFMGALGSLLAAEPVAFYELVMLCRDPAHVVWRPSVDMLKGRNLLEADGTTIHSSIRNLVLAAVEGEELEMRIVSPYAEVEA